jgi:hypothetical protein
VSDLESFRDHCRRMADAEHKPECCQCGSSWCCGCVGHPAGKPTGWAQWQWNDHAEVCPGNPTAPPCPGCVTNADRVLWTRLADEVDAYLSHDDAPLWEDA